MNDQLDRYLNRSVMFAQGLRQQFPEIWGVAGETVERTNSLMHTIHGRRDCLGTPELRLGLWGSMRRYQISSILSIFARDLDEGLSILRMAAELSRVLKVVSRDESLYSLWVGTENKASRHFRAAAKFDLDDPTEKRVFDTYNFCSSYGTHGHKTSPVYFEDTPIGKEPSLRGVSEVAKEWFLSAIPMHRLCLTCCVDGSAPGFPEYDIELTILEAKLLERVQNDAFFAPRPGSALGSDEP